MQVHIEDQVIFASEETEGQYMHTSSKTYHQVGITLHGHWLVAKPYHRYEFSMHLLAVIIHNYVI